MEKVTDGGGIRDNGPRPGIHRRLSQTGTAEMIATTAIGKLPTTAGTEGRVQIMDQCKTFRADHLASMNQADPTETATGGEDQFHTPPAPCSPGKHGLKRKFMAS